MCRGFESLLRYHFRIRMGSHPSVKLQKNKAIGLIRVRLYSLEAGFASRLSKQGPNEGRTVSGLLNVTS